MKRQPLAPIDSDSLGTAHKRHRTRDFAIAEAQSPPATALALYSPGSRPPASPSAALEKIQLEAKLRTAEERNQELALENEQQKKMLDNEHAMKITLETRLASQQRAAPALVVYNDEDHQGEQAELQEELQAAKEGMAELQAQLTDTKQEVEDAEVAEVQNDHDKEMQEQELQELRRRVAEQARLLEGDKENHESTQATQVELERARRTIKELQDKAEGVAVKASLQDSVAMQTKERALRMLQADNQRLSRRLETMETLEEELGQLRAKEARDAVCREQLGLLQAQHTLLTNKHQAWLDTMVEIAPEAAGPGPLERWTPLDLLSFVQDLQNNEVLLKVQQGQLQTSNKQAKVRLQLLQEAADTREAALKAEGARLQTAEEALSASRTALERARKDRTAYKELLDSYDAEAAVHNHDKERIARIQELEAALEAGTARTTAAQASAEAAQQTAAALTKELEKVEAEAAGMQAALGRGEFDPRTTKVLHFAMNPEKKALTAKKEATFAQLQEEVQSLRQALEGKDAVAVGDPSRATAKEEEIKQLKDAINTMDKKKDRLVKFYHQKVKEFRAACYALTGYKIEMVQQKDGKHNGFVLRSMYAEKEDDELLFKDTGAGLEVMETAFCKELSPDVLDVLRKWKSIPAFLSQVTLELWEKQTRL